MVRKVLFAAISLCILAMAVCASPIVERVESAREHIVETFDEPVEAALMASVFEGSGTPESPYLISSAEDLNRLATLTNNGNMLYAGKCYKLTRDIDFTENVMTPIGVSEDTPFMGEFDGDGYAIKNVSFVKTETNSAEPMYAGLFPYCVNASFKNLFVIDLTVNVKSNKSVYAGAVCGYLNVNDASREYYIKNCYVKTKMTVESGLRGIVGGLVGNIENLTANEIKVNILNNIADVDIFSEANTNQYAGGIAGLLDQKKLTFPVKNCCTKGSIELGLKSEFCAGGIVGGIIGSDSGVTESENRFDFDNCFTLCDIFYNGTPKAKRYYISALAGRGSADNMTGNLYYAEDINLSPSVVVSSQAVMGTPTERSNLLDKSFLESEMSFDFADTWIMKDGELTLKIRKPMLMYDAYVENNKIYVTVANPSLSHIIAAGYDSDGRLLASVRTFSSGMQFSLNLSSLEGADYVKIFALESLFSLKPNCESFTLDL